MWLKRAQSYSFSSSQEPKHVHVLLDSLQEKKQKLSLRKSNN